MNDKLEPCPFCGESNAVICNSAPGGLNGPYAVSCRSFECHGNIWALGFNQFSSIADAIAAWNRRTTLPDTILTGKR